MLSKKDDKFEPLLEAMKAATGDAGIITVLDDPRLVSFMDWVDLSDDLDVVDEDYEDEDWDEDEEEENCPLCKKGILDNEGGCSNPKCLINRMGG